MRANEKRAGGWGAGPNILKLDNHLLLTTTSINNIWVGAEVGSRMVSIGIYLSLFVYISKGVGETFSKPNNNTLSS